MKRLALLFTLLSVFLVKADIVILKNGQELKGDVVDEGPDGVLIDYYVTPTIKDQRLVSRDDIASITVVPPDEKAYKALGNLTSPPTLLDTSFHDALIEKKIPEYLAKYPYSRHLGELRNLLAQLEAERSRIRQGDRKIDGSWVTSSDKASDPYQMGALVKFARMKEQMQAGDCVAALQTYELLEKSYPGSKVLPEAVNAALAQMDLLEGKWAEAVANFDILEKKRLKAIASAPADQAKEIKDALDRDAALAKEAIAAAQNDGTKFFPVFPNNKEALGTLKTQIDTERARLLALRKMPMREGVKASDEASGLIAQGKLQQARDQLALAQKLWPANHDLAKLTTQLDQMAKAEAARQKAQPSGTASPKK